MVLTNLLRKWNLSRQLISGEVTDHSRVTVAFKKGELVFETKVAKK